MIGDCLFFVLYVLYHITTASAFQVQCPTNVPVGQATQCTWIRTPGDGSSFGLLLREITQDHGGTMVTTVRNTNQDQGTFEVTFPTENQYLLEVVRNLDSVSSTEVPQILASSSTITAKSSGQSSGSGSGSGGSGGDTSSAGGGDNSDTETSSSTSTTTTKQTNPGGGGGGATAAPTSRNTETQQNTQANTQAETQTDTRTTTPPSTATRESDTSDFQSTQSSVQVPGNLFPSPSSSPSSSSSDGASSNPGNTGLPDEGGSTVPTQSSTTSSSSSSPTSPISATKGNTNIGLIIGLILGLLALVLLFFALLVCFIRRRRRRATTAFYREKMGGRRLVLSSGSPEGGYGGAFASGVGAGVGGAGALVVSRPDTYEKTPVTATSGATDGHSQPMGSRRNTVIGSRVLEVSADRALAGYDTYSLSEYSDRTSRTGSLDSKIADLWRNARIAITGLTRTKSRMTIQSGYSGDGEGNIRADGSRSSSAGTHSFSLEVSEASSSEPSVFYTAVPKPQGDGVGQSMGSGIGWIKPTATTFKERSSPWFSSSLRPLPQADLPTSTVPSWHSNSDPSGIPFPSTAVTNNNLTVPGSHSAEGTEEFAGSHESYVSLSGLGLHLGSSSQNHAPGPGVQQRSTPELSSLNWDSTGRSSSGSNSSIISYPPVSHAYMTYESRTSHGRSDEY